MPVNANSISGWRRIHQHFFYQTGMICKIAKKLSTCRNFLPSRFWLPVCLQDELWYIRMVGMNWKFCWQFWNSRWIVCWQSEIVCHVMRPGQGGRMYSGWRRMSSMLFSSATPAADNVSLWHWFQPLLFFLYTQCLLTVILLETFLLLSYCCLFCCLKSWASTWTHG